MYIFARLLAELVFLSSNTTTSPSFLHQFRYLALLFEINIAPPAEVLPYFVSSIPFYLIVV
jgi:hypothetical protein